MDGTMMHGGKFVFCFALELEARPFRKFIAGREDVEVLLTGMGRINAEHSVGNYLRTNSPAQLLTCGFAGALNPQLRIGDVIAQKYPTPDIRHANVRSAPIAGLNRAKEGKFFCASRMVCTAAEKSDLFRTTGADAVEMESGIIHAMCGERGVACSTIRAISDTADQDLPLDFNRFINPNWTMSHSKLALGIMKAPWKIAALVQLQRNCIVASDRLAAFLLEMLKNYLPEK